VSRFSERWPLTESQTAFVKLVVGVLLVLNPLYIGYLNVGLWGHAYQTRTVTIDDGRISVESEPFDIPHESFDGIACSGFSRSYECPYQYAQFETEGYPVRVSGNLVNAFNGPPYVYQYGSQRSPGRYYRRDVDESDAGLTVSVDPVQPAAVLENVSVSPSELSLAGRWALLTGSIQIPHSLPMANHIIDTGGGYVVLVQTRKPTHLPDFERLMASAFGLLIGLGLVRSGYRRLIAL
jgi:hypothetical protein